MKTKIDNTVNSSKELFKEKISTENLLLFLNLNVLEKYCKETFELYSSLVEISFGFNINRRNV